MLNVRDTIQKKQVAFEVMQRAMTDATNRNIKAKKKFKQTMGVQKMMLPQFI